MNHYEILGRLQELQAQVEDLRVKAADIERDYREEGDSLNVDAALKAARIVVINLEELKATYSG